MALSFLFRFLTLHPEYKGRYSDISGITDGDLEDLRKNQDFEDKATLIYMIFDDVITNLENVDKALQNIQFGAPDTQFSQKMVKVTHSFLHLRAIKSSAIDEPQS